MDGADVSIWKVGFGYNGAGAVEGINASIVVGKTTYSLGVTAIGAFSYTTFVRYKDGIHGSVTTFTPKYEASGKAVGQTIHDVVDKTANYLYNTTNQSRPPFMGPFPSPGLAY